LVGVLDYYSIVEVAASLIDVCCYSNSD